MRWEYAPALCGWLAASVLAMALIEYAVHRWPMHAWWWGHCVPGARVPWYRHAVLHHGRFFKHDFAADPDPAANHVSVDLDAGPDLVGLAPLWLGLGLWSPLGGAAFALVIALHAWIWTAVHREMHAPVGRWFARTRYYRCLHDHHRAHHEHPGHNFAAVFAPWTDVAFRTRWRSPAGD